MTDNPTYDPTNYFYCETHQKFTAHTCKGPDCQGKTAELADIDEGGA